MDTYRVLIADDHPLARRAVRTMLTGDPSFEIVGEAADGREAVARCGELQPDLVLMDIHMPQLSGLEATKQIKSAFPHIRVVMLTVSDHAADLFSAIQYGAQGYLLKNMNPDDWLAYLRALLGDDSSGSRLLADKLFRHFHTGPGLAGGGRSASASGESGRVGSGAGGAGGAMAGVGGVGGVGGGGGDADPSVLTPRERELIERVSAGETNRQIAERLVIAENTVKNHVKNILDKLNLENRVQLTAYAVRHGLTHNLQNRRQK
ncbi:response regulator [Paenibacillus koleovorans]|uniref:response regulator n=1 Tax=Paenibacillus koleovorans TaxID=121608 RepID=UPI001FEB3AC6|nr:response regulator transcription factor [Paenibacillus koleovorans]